MVNLNATPVAASAVVSPFSIKNVTVAYHRKPVLWNITYELPTQCLAAIVGPNGAGKSTLIKAALGLLPVITGQFTFWDEPLRRVRQRIGYVPQRGSVDWDFPVSALEVVEMGRYAKIGWMRPVSRSHRDYARECLAQVQLADFADRQISQLSGGQQQRVFLARALAQQADLYFMDEPFAGVDAATETAIVDVLRELKRKKATVVVVHHDLSTVQSYFDEVLLLNGRVVASGPVETAFTHETLQRTYGGRLAVLSDVFAMAQPPAEAR